MAAGAVLFQDRRYDDPHIRYDRFELPAFDAYVYMAMADHPAFFTVAPWGYRVLTPWVVRVLPVRNVARGFRYVTLISLALAGALLFLVLRRLGHGEWPSLAAVAAFCLSPPVGEVVRSRFLVEPLTLALEVGFLLALEAGAGLALLALISALGTLSKEFFLLLAPAVYFARRARDGDRRALLATVVTAAPAVALTLLLRLWWTPHLAPSPAAWGLEAVSLAAERLRDTWDETWPAPLMGGLGPLALLGALRPQARPFLVRYGYLLVVTLVLPFVAWINVPSPTPVPIFGRNVLRLLVFALPLVLPLVLVLLDRFWPHLAPPPTATGQRSLVEASAATALALCLAFPIVALDRYRRVDLRGPRDGPLVLATSRETLRTANRLARGQEVTFEPRDRRFVWGVSDPGELSRMRWFLREGWGPLPHYGTGDVRMREREARVLVPLFQPRDLEVVLALDAPAEVPVAFRINGQPLGERLVKTFAEETALAIPAALLFRGDNLLDLQAAVSSPGVRLAYLKLRLGG